MRQKNFKGNAPFVKGTMIPGLSISLGFNFSLLFI